MVEPVLYRVPVWATGLILFAVLLLAIEVGFLLGRWHRKHWADRADGPGGDVAMTAMYALLGLVLAFTYSYTISRADMRKQAVIHEANAIGTAFLRARLAPEPARSELQTALRDYTAVRIIDAAKVKTPDDVREIVRRSVAVHARLWSATEQVIRQGGRGAIDMTIVQSVNAVIDMHTIRLAVSFDRLPGAVLWMLLTVAALTLGVSGYHRGLAGDMNRVRMLALAFLLALVMNTITDFDRGTEGWIRISQQPLVDALQGMTASRADGG